jgi:phosphate starvation-inducible PhoH-like protein
MSKKKSQGKQAGQSGTSGQSKASCQSGFTGPQECSAESSVYKLLMAKTPNQQALMDSIRKYTITYAEGPAGTGKTFIAVNLAIDALLSHAVSRIVLLRPAITAGEDYGFLPGEISNKLDPYLMAYYMLIEERVGKATLKRMLYDGRIQAVPIGFLLGMTLNDAFVLCDEMGNATREQIKLILTRLGECEDGSPTKCVLTGDVQQVYISGRTSGFSEMPEVFKDVPIFNVVRFNKTDVVRSEAVRLVLEAYDKHDSDKHNNRGDKHEKK